MFYVEIVETWNLYMNNKKNWEQIQMEWNFSRWRLFSQQTRKWMISSPYFVIFHCTYKNQIFGYTSFSYIIFCYFALAIYNEFQWLPYFSSISSESVSFLSAKLVLLNINKFSFSCAFPYFIHIFCVKKEKLLQNARSFVTFNFYFLSECVANEMVWRGSYNDQNY